VRTWTTIHQWPRSEKQPRCSDDPFELRSQPRLPERPLPRRWFGCLHELDCRCKARRRQSGLRAGVTLPRETVQPLHAAGGRTRARRGRWDHRDLGLVSTSETTSPAVAATPAGPAFLAAHDAAAPIEVDPTAGLDELLQLSPAALHAALHRRQAHPAEDNARSGGLLLRSDLTSPASRRPVFVHDVRPRSRSTTLGIR
jgi:hypothetical protein